ncbi:MAG: ribonuclease D [Gammaproteobacteria bacterium]
MSDGLVDSAQELAEVCRQIDDATHVALDTEFIRQRTYRPQLCLIQIAVGDNIYCVDPLAFDDLSDLMNRLNKVEVVIHSARQDLEAIYQTTGVMLAPVFDTQIAAGLTGLGDQISYSALVDELLEVELDKGETRTNWAQRPLTAAQKRYAEDDVRYLLQLYAPLRERLGQQSRTEWLEAECAALGDVALYEPDPDSSWSRVKGTRGLTRAQRRGMKRLAAWRERQAWDKDRPRKWIISDEDIITLASQEPKSPEDLAGLLDSKQRYLRQASAELFEQLQLAEEDPLEPPFSGHDPDEVKLIKTGMAMVRSAATKSAISPSLLGTRKDVIKVIRGEASALLETWRRELIGQELQQAVAKPQES